MPHTTLYALNLFDSVRYDAFNINTILQGESKSYLGSYWGLPPHGDHRG